MRFLLLVIITLLPTYLIRFHIGPIPTTFLELLLLFTFLYWCKEKIIHGLSETKSRAGIDLVSDKSDGGQTVSILLFTLAATISVFIAPDLRAALGLWKAYIVEPILFFIMFVDTQRRGWTTVWRDVTIALSFSALGVALPAIYQKFNPIGIPNIHWAAAETRRVTSWYGFPNALGLYLAPLIPFFVVQLFSSSLSLQERARVRLVKWYMAIVTITSLAAIFFARSEGAIASLLIVGFIAGMFFSRTRLWVTVITLVFVVATLTNTPWRDYVYEQIAFHGDSGKVRIQQWKETITMLRDRPILGAGLSGYQKTVAPYHKQKHIEIYQYPHNSILNFWSEMGLLGVIAFLWLIVIFFRKTISPLKIRGGRGSYDPMVIAAMASMMIILIHGLVDVPYFKNDLAIFFWFLLALTFIAEPSSVKEK